MLDLYARRNVVKGYAFKPDTTWQKELEDSFPYVETEDQKRAHCRDQTRYGIAAPNGSPVVRRRGLWKN